MALYDWIWCGFAALTAVCVLGVGPWMLGRRQRPDATLWRSLFEWMMPCAFGTILGHIGGFVTALLIAVACTAATSSVFGNELANSIFIWVGAVLGLGVSSLLTAKLIVQLHDPSDRTQPLPARKALRPAALIAVCATGLVLGMLPFHSRAMAEVRRHIDASNIKYIGTHLEEHRREYGAHPRDLRRLAELEDFRAYTLRSVAARRPKRDSRDPPEQIPCDFEYCVLPPDAPGGLVWVWQRAELHGGEGGNVLYKSGDVVWLGADELQAEVARTAAWLRRRASQPTSKPSGIHESIEGSR